MDLNVQAFRLVEEVTSEVSHDTAKRASSRNGGLKGGTARAKSIASERRVEIARKANTGRWHKQTPATSA